jgi:hypothetical protein
MNPGALLLLQATEAPAVRMSLSQFLRQVPDEVLFFSYVVGATFVVALGYGILAVTRLRSASASVRASLKRLGPLDDDVRLNGRSLTSVDAWRVAAEKLEPKHHPLAEDIERELVASLDQDGGRRFKLRDGEGGLWTLESFAGRYVNLAFLDAIPGILTAAGLVGTFVAIALGLGGLRSENNVILGIDLLLGSLGGKFVSSIVALGAALVFQLVDLLVFRRSFAKAHRQLLDTVADAFPALSPTQQITELLETAKRQERALANISSDVVSRFSDVFATNLLPDLGQLLAKSVQTEIGPVLAQVASGIGALEEGIRRLESGKQESIGAELRALTTSLETSLRQSLEQMGVQFRDALSGSADAEFKRAVEAMQGSAAVLSGMNDSFQTMQASMERLFEEAERRGNKAFEEGEGRTRALNQAVERLVAQLGENANANVQRVQEQVANAVAVMGLKLGEITGELERRTKEATEHAQAANQELVSQVTGAASRTTSETERLLAVIGQRASDFVAAADQLRELRQGVQAVLAETGQRVRELQSAADAFRSVATEVGTAAQALRDAQGTQLKTAEVTSGALVRSSEVVQAQAALVSRSSETFDTAARVLGGMDEQLGNALQTILTRMQEYNQVVEKNFERILTTVNAQMPKVFEQLGGLMQQVADAVDELNDALRQRR